MRQAYDYWQDQPGISPYSRQRLPPLEASHHHQMRANFEFNFSTRGCASQFTPFLHLFCKFERQSRDYRTENKAHQAPITFISRVDTALKTCYYPRCCSVEIFRHRLRRPDTNPPRAQKAALRCLSTFRFFAPTKQGRKICLPEEAYYFIQDAAQHTQSHCA